MGTGQTDQNVSVALLDILYRRAYKGLQATKRLRESTGGQIYPEQVLMSAEMALWNQMLRIAIRIFELNNTGTSGGSK